MPPVLNIHTTTIHTATHDERQETVACGSLEHIPEAYLRIVGDVEPQSDVIDRCRNCLEDGGGY